MLKLEWVNMVQDKRHLMAFARILMAYISSTMVLLEIPCMIMSLVFYILYRFKQNMKQDWAEQQLEKVMLSHLNAFIVINKICLNLTIE